MGKVIYSEGIAADSAVGMLSRLPGRVFSIGNPDGESSLKRLSCGQEVEWKGPYVFEVAAQ